ncbi:MAG: hypothetical protein V4640_02175 [Verrucomicrobiota bacterium]
MDDNDLLTLVLGMLDPTAKSRDGLSRNGRLLLAMPSQREAFSKALRLYQPQRPAAQWMTSALRLLAFTGIHKCLLKKIKTDVHRLELDPRLDGLEADSCGILLGSPEHKNRRAIASFRRNESWEVAKIAPSTEGADALESESDILIELGSRTPGVPAMLGFHRCGKAALLRMPYLTGVPISPSNSTPALDLLKSWISSSLPIAANEFPEWPAIESALHRLQRGPELLALLSSEKLHPTIRHGDFARWNLLAQPDGSLVVLDWEWGHSHGMPGLDMVHYFLQDYRLVHRCLPQESIRQTITRFHRSDAVEILAHSGWRGHPLLTIIASLAFKQGAAHQDNQEMLKAAIAQFP